MVRAYALAGWLAGSLSLSLFKFFFLIDRFLEGRDFARHVGCKFIETSAKDRINVDEAFTELVRDIRRYNRVCFSPLIIGCVGR